MKRYSVEGAVGQTPNRMNESKTEGECLKFKNLLQLCCVYNIYIKFACTLLYGMCDMLNNTLKIHSIGITTLKNLPQ